MYVPRRNVGSCKVVFLLEVSCACEAGANAVTGDFSIDSEGFTIENGKIGHAVRSFTVAGNFFTLLQNIHALDNRLSLDYPSGVTVLGAPDILVDGLSVAGK